MAEDDLEFVRDVIARALIAAIAHMTADEFRAVIAKRVRALPVSEEEV